MRKKKLFTHFVVPPNLFPGHCAQKTLKILATEGLANITSPCNVNYMKKKNAFSKWCSCNSIKGKLNNNADKILIIE